MKTLIIVLLLLASNCFAQLRLGIKSKVDSNIHETCTIQHFYYTNASLSNLYVLQYTTNLINWKNTIRYLQVVDSRRTNHGWFLGVYKRYNRENIAYFRLAEVDKITGIGEKYTVYYDHATLNGQWTLFYDQFGNWLPGYGP